MKIILNRDDIEKAVEAYVRDNFLPYGDKRELDIVQGTKATATITFIQENKLPGLDGNPCCPEDKAVEEEATQAAVAEDEAADTQENESEEVHAEAGKPITGPGFPSL